MDERPVAQGEQWFRALLDGAPALVWIGGPDGACTYFNRAWLEFTGRTLEQELGMGWSEGVHPDDLKRCVDTYLSHVVSRTPFRMEYRLRRADGTYGTILDDGAPRYDESGRFVGFVGSCVDVTERKRAEEALRAQSVTRSLARRLITEIISRGNVQDGVLRETGRALASEVEGGTDLHAYAAAYGGMGFGRLRCAEDANGRVTFTGEDLIERRTTSTLPTCFLTLGFLEGAVSRARGVRALGSELRCQSLGHAECQFNVRTR